MEDQTKLQPQSILKLNLGSDMNCCGSIKILITIFSNIIEKIFYQNYTKNKSIKYSKRKIYTKYLTRFRQLSLRPPKQPALLKVGERNTKLGSLT